MSDEPKKRLRARIWCVLIVARIKSIKTRREHAAGPGIGNDRTRFPADLR
jgi:hypothetical protein